MSISIVIQWDGGVFLQIGLKINIFSFFYRKVDNDSVFEREREREREIIVLSKVWYFKWKKQCNFLCVLTFDFRV